MPILVNGVVGDCEDCDDAGVDSAVFKIGVDEEERVFAA